MMNSPETDEMLTFSALPLSAPLARAVQDMDYTQPTSIQAAAIPFLLEGQDVIGHSSTGTGKTAAFGIPAVECVVGEVKRAQVLVLSPTRELAMQITREIQKYAKYKEGVCAAAIYGGAPMPEQIRLLRRANIVVGTPGRIMDHLRRKTLKMDELKMVVLDEADEMLSMGFIEDIQTILSQAPAERQTVLFSATMPPPILKISQEFLRQPQVVDVMAEEDSQADIEQTFYYVPQQKKQEALTLLLKHADAGRSIVFCNTKSMVDELATKLSKEGFRATGLHGDMSQSLRSQVMLGFRTGNIGILVATDVAARGIDVDDVDAVINFDLPQSFEYYVHRIGRTGRAGKKGTSQTLVCNGKQVATLKALIRFTGNEITEHRLPTGTDMMERAVLKMADELFPQLQAQPGKAASLLVKRLMGEETSGITAQQVACVLAEKLLGGDDTFAAIKGINDAASTQKAGRANAGYNSDGEGGMVVVTASVGRSARITPNHLVGAIAEILDIPGSAIGKIDIKDETSQIGMRENIAQALLAHKKPIRIKGQEVTFAMKPVKRAVGRKPVDPERFRAGGAMPKRKLSSKKGHKKSRY
ncbi:DEAD/DEAH box helicase [Ruminococcaceae bacterium OttesenSCG-928-A16]|nr:DEAD/DEAH box helicase [Ruminococcaceae bacterium OttesenSCG-928-A16]